MLLENLQIPLEPVPASRPRVTRWGVYYGKKYTAFMEAFKELVLPITQHLGNLWIYAEFVCKRPKKVTRETPVGDIDNYAKALLDGLTKQGAWKDDDQVTLSVFTKRYAEPEETPHINVLLGSAA